MKHLYKWFGKVTKADVKRFSTRRLPLYLLGLFILSVWGVKGFMITFAILLSFCLGWFTSKMITVVKDYRLSQRLNRVYFTEVEFQTMKRERDLALEAWHQLDRERERNRGVKAASMPPMPPGYQSRIDPDEIREMTRRYLEEEGAQT